MKLLFSLYNKAKKYRQRVYLKWIRRQFKSFGEHSEISHIDNLTNPDRIEVGENVRIGRHCVLEVFRGRTDNPSIRIGDRSIISDYCHLGAIDHIHIGEDVSMGRFVLIEDHNHGDGSREMLDIAPIRRPLVSKGGIVIGNRVWIGDKVTILSGVTIGDGAVIGANAVVTKDIPPYSAAAGCPAKVIRP